MITLKQWIEEELAKSLKKSTKLHSNGFTNLAHYHDGRISALKDLQTFLESRQDNDTTG